MIKQLCKKYDVRVFYFLSYFSDYNLIEKFFSMFKKWLKQYYEIYDNEKFFKKNFYINVKACSNKKLVKQHFRHIKIYIT